MCTTAIHSARNPPPRACAAEDKATSHQQRQAASPIHGAAFIVVTLPQTPVRLHALPFRLHYNRVSPFVARRLPRRHATFVRPDVVSRRSSPFCRIVRRSSPRSARRMSFQTLAPPRRLRALEPSQRVLAANLPRVPAAAPSVPSSFTHASSQPLPSPYALAQSVNRTRAPLLCPTPSNASPGLHHASPHPAAHDAHATVLDHAVGTQAQPLQYHVPHSSHQVSAPCVTPPHTMSPATPHMQYGMVADTAPSGTPIPNASTATCTYAPVPTSPAAWSGAPVPPSSIAPQVLPQPQYMPYMRSAPPSTAYYMYPPVPSQYVPHPAYYAPNYAMSTYATVPQHQQQSVHGTVAEPQPPHPVATPTISPSQLPIPQSHPAVASQQQQQQQQQQPLMAFPLYVNMPQYSCYAQPLTPKKRRLQWTPDLHSKFVKAVEQYGIDDAVPKLLLRAMNVPGLTRENVASHLQKYREGLRKKKQAAHSLSDPVHTNYAAERNGVRREAEHVDEGLEESRKLDDVSASSSQGVNCESSELSSSEQNSCIRTEGGVHGAEGRLCLSEQALKKRRLSESPT